MATDTENTRWVEGWAVNECLLARQLVEAAEAGPDALRAFVEYLWTSAPKHSDAGYRAREMAPGDYDRVDWAEVAEMLCAPSAHTCRRMGNQP